MKIMCVIGARPNFIKIAPLMAEFKNHKEIEAVLVHTGQHYDYEMSEIFFKELEMPEPKYNLNVGSLPRQEQINLIIEKLGPVIEKERPDLVIVVGDVNSTLAGALAAKKFKVPVAHIEAGLRSFDRKMVEEENRIQTDRISDFLFASEKKAVDNLAEEGISKDKIFFVGNIMIDSLLKAKPVFLKSKFFEELGLEKGDCAVFTSHRPENIDNPENLENILGAIEEISKKIKIVWPVHPRAQKISQRFSENKNIILIKPAGYINMLNLISKAKFVITDSGGIQEETTSLGIPCLTIRNNTERPVTVDVGTNLIIGTKKENIIKEVENLLAGKIKKGKIPEYWDGKTAERITKILLGKIK